MDDQNRHDIRIAVKTDYLSGQSDPDQSRFVFAYTITIQNHGDVGSRLLARHWVITDSNGHVQEVSGDGVVGEQPFLKPGQGFRYSSGAILETPAGFMQGSYRMIDMDGEEFDASIPPFTLAIPGALH